MSACDTSRCRFSQYTPRTTFSTGKKRSGVWYVRSVAIILRTAKGLLWCGYLGIEYGAVSPVRTALGGVSKAPWCVWSHFQPIVDRSSLWSAEQGKYNSPYPRTCLVDLVSRERFDSLSRVSLLILHA